jgi:hypothetical protein
MAQRDRSDAAVVVRAPGAAAVDSALSSSSGTLAAMGVSGGSLRLGTSRELGANVESLQKLLARSNTWSVD